MKYTLIILSILLTISACKKSKTVPNPGPGVVIPPAVPVIVAPPAFGYYVVGYIPYYRDPALIPDVKYRMCNVMNYAFATVTSNGGLAVQVPANLTTVVTKARANGCKVFISLNGSTTDWANMAVTATGRNNFIKATMNIVRQYALDGVDVDWEFPSTADGTDVTFTALMKEMSDSCHLDKKYYITMAVTSGKYAGSIRDAIKPELFPYLDFVNIMAYDDFNTTVPYRHHSDVAMANTCLNFWLNTRGLPAAKCVLGTACYARPSGMSQSGAIVTYNSVITTHAGNPMLDSAVVTLTSVNGGNPYTVYYPGIATTKTKAAIARTRANGIMFWEQGQDAHNNNSLTKAACDTVGRVY